MISHYMLIQCSSLRYRMILVRNSSKGRMRLQGYTHFTNHLQRWRNSFSSEENKIIHPRLERDKKGPARGNGNDQSKQQAGEDEE